MCAVVSSGLKIFPQRVYMHFFDVHGGGGSVGVLVCSGARGCILWVLVFVGVMCVCTLWVLCVCVHTHIAPTNYVGVTCVRECVVCGCLGWGCYVCVCT